MEEHKEKCIQWIKQGELLLIMAGGNVIAGYYKKKGGEVVEADIRVHQGMIQDSVLVQYAGDIDFRFFPQGWNCDEIQPYQWSESIDRIIISNVGEKLKFISSDDILVCEQGEELVVERGDYYKSM